MRASLVVLASVASAWLTVAACSSSTPASGAQGADGDAGLTFVLDGVYVVVDPDAGADADADPLDVTGDVWRFHDGRYLLHPQFCATADADGGAADDDAGDDDAGDADPLDVFPTDLAPLESCDQSGSFVIAADGASISLTRDADGTTVTESFVPEQWQVTEVTTGDDGGVAAQSAPLDQRGAIGMIVGSGGPVVTPVGKVVKTADVTLVKAGGQLIKALPGCSGQSGKGSDTGAFIRLASTFTASCLQSQLVLPSFDIPAGPNGAPYCTSFANNSSCKTSNYYGRHGIGFIYDEFLDGTSQAECGFEYMPGADDGGVQGDPRWVPYIRGAGGEIYGRPNGSGSGYRPGTAITLLCSINSSGHLQMTVNGGVISGADAPHPVLTTVPAETFNRSLTHVLRVTALAWPETMNKTSSQTATLQNNNQFFPAYTCQPMNKLQVTYTSTLACTPQSTTPTQPFICGTGQGAATWPGGGQAIGYTLTPSSEVSDVPMGAACTDTLFPNGG